MPYHLKCECGTLNITIFGEVRCECGRTLIAGEEATMPRPAHEDTPRKITLSLPSSLMAQVELLLIDPLTGRTQYGSVSTLVCGLLKNWIGEQTSKEDVVNTTLTTTKTKENNA